MIDRNADVSTGRWSPLALCVTWFGAGYLPLAPGTWGSLAALPFALLLHWIGGGLLLAIAAVVVAAFGFWTIHRYLAGRASHDPQEVVIDEVAGQWLTLIPLALTPLSVLVGFLVFRLLDTTKPWPIRRLERLPGSLGVMADDLAAGVAGAVVSFAILELAGQL